MTKANSNKTNSNANKLASNNANSNNILTTHGSIMLHHWPVLLNIVTDIARIMPQPDADKINKSSTISEAEFMHAVSSPFRGWLLQVLSFYGQLMDWSLQLAVYSDKTIKESLQKYGQGQATPPLQPLDKDVLKKLTKVKLEGIQKNLDTLTKEQYDAWKLLYQQWLQQISNNIANSGISLNSDEQAALQRFDLSHEMVNFANEVQLKLDKKLYSPDSFAVYLQLKAILAIHSSLSRQQKLADLKSIMQYMKNSKTLLSVVAKQEQEQLKLDKTKLEEVLVL